MRMSRVRDFRVIPSIDQLRQRPGVSALAREYGDGATTTALRAAAAALRAGIAGGRPAPTLHGRGRSRAHRESTAAAQLAGAVSRLAAPVINATGVIIHTNLGRAPLAAAALERVSRVAQGYSNLEYDLGRGHRGSRTVHAEALLTALTGAEAAVVVNNNAAATLLILAGAGARAARW